MDAGDSVNEGIDRPGGPAVLNAALAREGFEVFYAPDKLCYLRNVATDTVDHARRQSFPAIIGGRDEKARCYRGIS
jgi:hypothetical protein